MTQAIPAMMSAPLAPYTHVQRFDHTGSVQNFTVPPGVTTINARCWGGGGAGPGTGGGGGFAGGDIDVVPGEVLAVVVDLGGGQHGGGGMSGLYSRRLGQTLLIAGGGGACSAADVPGARAGAGGGAAGLDGRDASRLGWTGTPARGASGATGGAGAAESSGYRSLGGRGGNNGSNGVDATTYEKNGARTSYVVHGGQVPIAGMGGGGGGGAGSSTGGGAGYAGGGGGTTVAGARGDWSSGGAGGSGFVGGPGVTGGQSLPGNGSRAGGQSDPLYQSPVGEAGHRGQVVLQWSQFTVTPGGPPDVDLTQGGAVGYPGVRVDSGVAFAPVEVTVTLPAGAGLLFGTQILADHQLTVQNAAGQQTPYTGSLSPDGSSLHFSGVDLHMPGSTVMWVAVSADHGAAPGTTSLAFTVGGKACPSTTIVVRPDFVISPAGTPLTLARGGTALRYPGVEVTGNSTSAVPPQTVTVTLPTGSGLRFGTVAAPDHQLTIRDADGNDTPYPGSISPDGLTLTFTNVDLAIPTATSQSVMWVCVSADDTAPLGSTDVEFSFGTRTSPSTTLDIV
ncbi:hypothetical protein ACFRMQ_11765 [Kitasatospora sp. NPDC056783]|uniref:hypothetical protein n=1 Tax=Kitasatospora sp. NPDC056783 TaxID=3345943 RepID=UPI0036B0C6F8